MRPDILTKKLKSLVLKKLEQGNLQKKDQGSLEAALDALFEKGASVEQDIVSVLLDDLDDVEGAADILLNEIEISSTMVVFAGKPEMVAVLFALPVVFLAGDQFREVAFSTDDTLEMCNILTETDIVSPQAGFGLLPRLFTPAELQGQSYGMLQQLTRSLGRKLRDGEPLRLESGILNQNAPATDKFAWGDNPHIDLRFLVGAAYIQTNELFNIFPPVGPETVEGMLYAAGQGDEPGERAEAPTPPDPASAEDEGTDEPPAGVTPEGEFWEPVFCDAVTNAFFSMRGCRGAVLPHEFNDAMRSGLEYWREFGLQHQVDMGFQEDETVILDCTDFEDTETGRFGWEIQMNGEDGTSRGVCRWEILMHETGEESQESLESLSQNMGWVIRSITPVEIAQ